MNPFYSEWIHFIPNESKMSYQHGVSALLGVVMYAVGGGEIPGGRWPRSARERTCLLFVENFT